MMRNIAREAKELVVWDVLRGEARKLWLWLSMLKKSEEKIATKWNRARDSYPCPFKNNIFEIRDNRIALH